jgi:hypothetical protein
VGGPQAMPVALAVLVSPAIPPPEVMHQAQGQGPSTPKRQSSDCSEFPTSRDGVRICSSRRLHRLQGHG